MSFKNLDSTLSSSTVLDKIKSLGCHSTLKIMLAFETYEELTRIEKLKQLTCQFSVSLDLIYIVGNKDGVPITYVPILSSFELSPLWIQNVQNELSLNNPKSIVLIIRDADSNLVRYTLTQDLVLPSEYSNRQSKSSAIQSSLQTKKRKRNIVELNFA